MKEIDQNQNNVNNNTSLDDLKLRDSVVVTIHTRNIGRNLFR